MSGLVVKNVELHNPNDDVHLGRDQRNSVKLWIDGLVCEEYCTKVVRTALLEVASVTAVTIDFQSGQAVVEGVPALDDLCRAVKAVGYGAIPMFTIDSVKTPTQQSRRKVGGALQTVCYTIDGIATGECYKKIQEALAAAPAVFDCMVDVFASLVTLTVACQQAANILALQHALEVAEICSLQQQLRLKTRSSQSEIDVSEGFYDGTDASPGQVSDKVVVSDPSGPTEASGAEYDYRELTTPRPIEPLKSSSDKRLEVLIDGMTCQTCVQSVESVLRQVEGVRKADVNLMTEKAAVHFDPRICGVIDILEAVRSVGYESSVVGDTLNSVSLQVEGMTCSSCSNTIESGLRALVGVFSATVNLSTETVFIKFDSSKTSVHALVDVISSLGYTVVLSEEGKAGPMEGATQSKDRNWIAHQRRFIGALLLAIPVWIVMLLKATGSIDDALEQATIPGMSLESLLTLPFATAVQFWSGRSFYWSAWSGLRHRNIGMAMLVVLGTSVAYFYSAATILYGLAVSDPAAGDPMLFFDSSTLITFILLGKLLEGMAKSRTADALARLASLQSKTALLMGPNGEVEVPVEQLHKGDIVKVIRGSIIPADGNVTEGRGEVDESMITGESVPVSKVADAQVIGGTVAIDGLLLVRVERVGEASTLCQIMQLVENAQLSKPPIQELADRISGVFVGVMIVIALLAFVIWWSLSAGGVVPVKWLHGDSSFLFALMFAVSTLVVACPCALGLATPTAMMVGTGVGARYGVLIKGGEPLQKVQNVTTVVFDKTGTLTKGVPVVSDWIPAVTNASRTAQFMRLAVIAEQNSEHPIARAIVNFAKKQGGEDFTSKNDFLTNFKAVSGGGVVCTVGGHEIVIGNKKFLAQFGIAVDASVNDSSSRLTVVWGAMDGEMIGSFLVTDEIRQEAAVTVGKLHKMNVRVRMLTGDNWGTAERVATALDIPMDCVTAEMLPDDKINRVKMFQAQGEIVAMVGDGINDSPSLAQADIGIAIGAGTQVAMETADVVLMKSDLRDVVTVLDLSRVVYHRICWNFVGAFVYNVCLIPFAAGIWYPLTEFALPPWVSGIAMALSSVTVVVSSLLLNLYRPPRF